MVRFSRRINRDKVFDVVITVIMLLIALLFLIPLINVLACSFSSPDSVVAGEVG